MNIIIFGLGQIGQDLIIQIKVYSATISVIAICDNNDDRKEFMGIPVIKPEKIHDYVFDEVWIATVYFESIICQLERLSVDRKRMFFVEPVVPILEERIRKKLEYDNAEELFPQEPDPVLIDFIRDHKLKMYNYPFYDEYLNRESSVFFDEQSQLFYGLYMNKKMYLARRYNTLEKAKAYFNTVTMEQDQRSPHCYWNFDRFDQINGCVVDVGAAEGVFGLKIIDDITHLYMVEADPEWIEALNCTYREYKDKVTIVPKYADDFDADDRVKIDTLIGDAKVDVIKIDIEGMEMKALRGGECVIIKNRPAMAICVYHHKQDNKQIGEWIEERGFSLRNSEGYVVCTGEWELDVDETGFRRALLYAW